MDRLRVADILQDEPNLRKKSTEIDVHVGEQVRMLRALSRMSQERLGQHLGVSFQQVQKFEKGVNRLSSGYLWKIAQVFGVGVDRLFQDAPIGERSVVLNDSFMSEFMQMPEGIAIARALVAIEEKKVRRRLVLLAQALAREADDEAGEQEAA